MANLLFITLTIISTLSLTYLLNNRLLKQFNEALDCKKQKIMLLALFIISLIISTHLVDILLNRGISERLQNMPDLTIALSNLFFFTIFLPSIVIIPALLITYILNFLQRRLFTNTTNGTVDCTKQKAILLALFIISLGTSLALVGPVISLWLVA